MKMKQVKYNHQQKKTILKKFNLEPRTKFKSKDYLWNYF